MYLCLFRKFMTTKVRFAICNTTPLKSKKVTYTDIISVFPHDAISLSQSII